jgi:hypothetical protein
VTILFFELFFYYKQRQGADDQQYEEQPDDLFKVLMEGLEAKSKKKTKLFRRFVQLHDKESFPYHCDYFLNVVETVDLCQKRDLIDLLLDLELRIHRGIKEDVHFCQKMNYKTPIGPVKKCSKFNIALHKLRQHTLVQIYKLLALLFGYYLGYANLFYLQKRVTRYFPLSNDNFSIFGCNLTILLSAGVVVPAILNLVFIFSKKQLPASKFYLVCLFLMSPAIPLVSVYCVEKLKQIKEHRIRNACARKNKVCKLPLRNLESHIKSSKILFSFTAIQNLNMLFTRVVVALFLIFIELSKTNTTNPKMEKSLYGKESVFLVLSAILSTYCLGNMHAQLNGHRRLIMKCFGCISAVARIFSIVIFFAPTLGIFDLLMHYKTSQIPVAERTQDAVVDILENGTVVRFRDVWLPMRGYEDLTGSTLEQSYIIFLCIIALHISCATILKFKLARGFKSGKEILTKTVHILSQGDKTFYTGIC